MGVEERDRVLCESCRPDSGPFPTSSRTPSIPLTLFVKVLLQDTFLKTLPHSPVLFSRFPRHPASTGPTPHVSRPDPGTQELVRTLVPASPYSPSLGPNHSPSTVPPFLGRPPFGPTLLPRPGSDPGFLPLLVSSLSVFLTVPPSSLYLPSTLSYRLPGVCRTYHHPQTEGREVQVRLDTTHSPTLRLRPRSNCSHLRCFCRWSRVPHSVPCWFSEPHVSWFLCESCVCCRRPLDPHHSFSTCPPPPSDPPGRQDLCDTVVSLSQDLRPLDGGRGHSTLHPQDTRVPRGNGRELFETPSTSWGILNFHRNPGRPPSSHSPRPST